MRHVVQSGSLCFLAGPLLVLTKHGKVVLLPCKLLVHVVPGQGCTLDALSQLTLMPCLRSSWLTVAAPEAPAKRSCHTCRPSPVQSTTRPEAAKHMGGEGAGGRGGGDSFQLESTEGRRLEDPATLALFHTCRSAMKRPCVTRCRCKPLAAYHTHTLRQVQWSLCRQACRALPLRHVSGH